MKKIEKFKRHAILPQPDGGFSGTIKISEYFNTDSLSKSGSH